MSNGLRPAGAAVKQWGRSVKRPAFLSARSPPVRALRRAHRAVQAASPALSGGGRIATSSAGAAATIGANPCRTRGTCGAPIGSLRSGLLSNNQARGFAWPMNGSPFGPLREPSSLVGRKDSTRSQPRTPETTVGCETGPPRAEKRYPIFGFASPARQEVQQGPASERHSLTNSPGKPVQVTTPSGAMCASHRATSSRSSGPYRPDKKWIRWFWEPRRRSPFAT